MTDTSKNIFSKYINMYYTFAHLYEEKNSQKKNSQDVENLRYFFFNLTFVLSNFPLTFHKDLHRSGL